MPQRKKKKVVAKKEFPEPDDFTVAFRQAMRSLRRAEIEEHIRQSPNVPTMPSSERNVAPDEGEIRRRADLILADMELEKQKRMGAFSRKAAKK